jgi:phage shock protein PspC (stress-responsive transcriptional regulator)
MEGTPTGTDPGGESRFARETPGPPPTSTTGPPTPASSGGLGESRDWLSGHGLVRPRHGRMIAGVCAGFARRYGVPVFLVRVLTVVAGVAGFGLLGYLVMWILMPNEP